jgi:hypothetical protein
MKEVEMLKKAAREIYLFLWELKIRIKIMPQEKFLKILNELTTEQKIHAIYFWLLWKAENGRR